ncbi:hypothetical protein HELRODRAFT_165159 [Helobdella robusta]|uniref:Uncharacterized protein n=1 Tax=Helobdella robusta TaxID=6412 RepID=T1EWC5_HELRO|nr:hypothetical protein HELRODRAFT_165159 [Helobdella robusta]ESN93004.1 hypothetical protein HELRODRAFT_165159 [Helobdella robusta]
METVKEDDILMGQKDRFLAPKTFESECEQQQTSPNITLKVGFDYWDNDVVLHDYEDCRNSNVAVCSEKNGRLPFGWDTSPPNELSLVMKTRARRKNYRTQLATPNSHDLLPTCAPFKSHRTYVQ